MSASTGCVERGARGSVSTGLRRPKTAWVATVLVAFAVTTAVPTAVAAQGRRAQNMCAECDVLREQLAIVRGKSEAFAEGLQLLRQTRRDLGANRSVANRLAAAYTSLQGLNVAFSLATLPCSIPHQWLKGLIGGAAGLGVYVQERDAGEATLAAVVSSLGFGKRTSRYV